MILISFLSPFQSKYNKKNVAKLYLYENTAKRKLNVICFHISLAISSLDLIGPEDTKLGDLKIAQPPKLGHLTLFLLVDHVAKPGGIELRKTM